MTDRGGEPGRATRATRVILMYLWNSGRTCYAETMAKTTKPAVRNRDTRVVPSPSLEEVEALSPTEREKLVAELKAAEARIDAGELIVYDRDDQRRRFEKTYSGRT